jgi:30S ribosomal protein S31
MGKGDKKTKKGKIFKGSFGKSRPANKPVIKSKAKEAGTETKA